METNRKIIKMDRLSIFQINPYYNLSTDKEKGNNCFFEYSMMVKMEFLRFRSCVCLRQTIPKALLEH